MRGFMFLIVEETKVFHYGELKSLEPLSGRVWEFEGDTLSVSLCPFDWLGAQQASSPRIELYELTRQDGRDARFIDLVRLSERNLDEIDRWLSVENLGSIRSPDLVALGTYHRSNIPPQYGTLCAKLAWAKAQDVDGIWFTDSISQRAPTATTGGIFQHRIPDFVQTLRANLGSPHGSGWSRIAPCRLPHVRLATL